MPQRETIVYLQDILDAIEKLRSIPATMDLQEFETAEFVAAAAERYFMVVGEALRVVRLRDATLADRIIELPQIISLRNLVAHIYWHVNRKALWNIILTDVPILREQVSKELAALTPPV